MSEQKLPMATLEGAPAAGGGNGAAPTPAPIQVEASSIRLVGTLALAGAIAGLAIVMAFQWAKPRIDAHKAEVLAQAVTQVVGGAERYQTVYLEGDHFTAEPKAGAAPLDSIYVAYDADGHPRGVAIEAAEAGFQDVIDLLFGYDPARGDVIGMTVLTANETPGLGAKITSDSSFIKDFDDVGTPLLGVKKGQGKGKHDEVVMITGATISSRAVIKIINDRLQQVQKQVDAYWSTIGGATAAAPETTKPATPSGGDGL